MKRSQNFNTPTLVSFRKAQYWVIDVCEEWGSCPAIRLQPVKPGEPRIVVTKDDPEWADIVIVKGTKTLRVNAG